MKGKSLLGRISVGLRVNSIVTGSCYGNRRNSTMRCCGMNKQGGPCGCHALKGRSYSRWHLPVDTSKGLCRVEALTRSSASRGVKCSGTNRFGDPCGCFAIHGLPHCQWHGPICQGTSRNGEPCKASAKKELGWQYCRHHDPNTSIPKTETDTTEFRIKNLCSLKSNAVLEWRGGRDAYTGRAVRSIGEKELDHVVELHVVWDALDSIRVQGMGFRVSYAHYIC